MRCVLLDLDRTLVDLQSFTDYEAAWSELRGFVDPALAGTGPATGWSWATRACMSVLAALPDGDTWRAASAAVARHERAAIARSRPMPGVASFLAGLADRPRAVVTLLTPGVARDTLAAHGLGVDLVVGRDPGIRPKPSGDGLRTALATLGCPASGAVMVGDSTWDAAAATDAGVPFVGVHARPEEFATSYPDAPVFSSLVDALPALA